MSVRPYHHGDLRAALLDRAVQTVRDKGADALSLRELARDIGVSHAAPSRHFKDKQALLDALALDGFERLGDALTRANATPGEFGERFRAVARAYADFAIEDAALLELMFARKHTMGASEELLAAGWSLGVPIQRLIEDGQRSGYIGPGDVESIVRVMFASVHGFAMLTASGMLPADSTRDGLEEIVEVLAKGLRPA